MGFHFGSFCYIFSFPFTRIFVSSNYYSTAFIYFFSAYFLCFIFLNIENMSFYNYNWSILCMCILYQVKGTTACSETLCRCILYQVKGTPFLKPSVCVSCIRLKEPLFWNTLYVYLVSGERNHCLFWNPL